MSSSSPPIKLSRSSKVWPNTANQSPTGGGDVHQAGGETGARTPTPNVEFRRLGGHRRRAPSGASGATNNRTLGQRWAKLRKRVRSSCRVLASDFSEVCFVSGIITALIGSLVAISGIFTRNQARIRLYMEGFGCGMVILGVLVVFFSLKLRASKDFELNQSLGNLFQTSHHSHASPHARFLHHQQQLLMQQQQQQQQLQLHYLNSLQSSLADHSPEPAPTLLPELPLVVTTTLAAAGGGGLQRRDGPLESIRATSSLVDLTSGRRASEDSLSLASLCGANDQGQAWTPCMAPDLNSSSGVYNGHERATIEAALSIVLTAATIAGFRPGQTQISRRGMGGQAGRSPATSGGGGGGEDANESGDKHEHFCCLHHTVQHKLQARKWIHCLRVADQPLDVECIAQAPATATEPKTNETFKL